MKIFTPFSTVALAVVFFSAPLFAAEKPAFSLTYKSNDVQSDIFINGIRVTGSRPRVSSSGAADIGRFIMPGKNEIEIKVKKGKSPSASFAVHIFEADLAKGQAMTGDGNEIFGHEEAKNHKGVLNITQAPPSELWGKVDTLQNDKKTQADAVAFLKEFVKAYKAKEAQKVAAMLSLRLIDMEIGAYRPAPTEKEMNEQASQMIKAIRLTDFSPKGLSFDLVGNGQVLAISRKGKPGAIIGKAQGEEVHIEVYLARRNGKWVFAR